MSSPLNDFEERLHKVRAELSEVQERARKAQEDLERSGTSPFVEYATMFKLESRPRPSMILDETPRNLECVNCGVLLLRATYSLDPRTFDRKCRDCGVRARDFYKTRPCRELNDAEKRDD